MTLNDETEVAVYFELPPYREHVIRAEEGDDRYARVLIRRDAELRAARAKPAYICRKCYWVGINLAKHVACDGLSLIDTNEESRKLIEELDEARKEIERLRGFESCLAKRAGGICQYARSDHDAKGAEYREMGFDWHEFLPGAFDDATTEGK